MVEMTADHSDTGAVARDSTSRERFLEAAEDQFIARGYDGCTIRAIAAQAGTGLASLSRNWKSKHHLFDEMFRRHFDPIHAAQEARFDEIERTGNLSAKAIIEAFFGAALGRESQEKSHRVYCHALLDPSEEARSITRGMVGPVRLRLIALMRRALPHLDETRFFLAMNIVLGVYIYPQAHGHRLAAVMDFAIERIDWQDAAGILAQLLADGLSARS